METCSALLALYVGNSPVNSPHKGHCRGALKFAFICICTKGWASNLDAGNLRRHRVHYDVAVMNYGTKVLLTKCSGNKFSLNGLEMYDDLKTISLDSTFNCFRGLNCRKLQKDDWSIIHERFGLSWTQMCSPYKITMACMDIWTNVTKFYVNHHLTVT